MNDSNGSLLRLRYENGSDSSNIGNRLSIIVEEQGIVTEFDLRQLNNSSSTMDAFKANQRLLGEPIVECMLKPEALKFLVQIPENEHSGLVTLEICSDRLLKITYDKPDIKTEIEIDANSALVENLTLNTAGKCPDLSFTYQYSFLKPSAKALINANKVSIRIDANGFMYMQILLLQQQVQHLNKSTEMGVFGVDDDFSYFIDYFILPNY